MLSRLVWLDPSLVWRVGVSGYARDDRPADFWDVAFSQSRIARAYARRCLTERGIRALFAPVTRDAQRHALESLNLAIDDLLTVSPL